MIHPKDVAFVNNIAGAAVGAITGGVVGGALSVAQGGTFSDGFASGVMTGMISGAIAGGIAGYKAEVFNPFINNNPTTAFTIQECAILFVAAVAIAAWYYSMKQTGDQVDEIFKDINSDANSGQNGGPQSTPASQQGSTQPVNSCGVA